MNTLHWHEICNSGREGSTKINAEALSYGVRMFIVRENKINAVKGYNIVLKYYGDQLYLYVNCIRVILISRNKANFNHNLCIL